MGAKGMASAMSARTAVRVIDSLRYVERSRQYPSDGTTLAQRTAAPR